MTGHAVSRPSRRTGLSGGAAARSPGQLLLAYVALTGTGQDWPHLVKNVLPGASVTTLWLMAMVAAATSIAGVASAWMVVAYEFPLRRTLAWVLVLPLAVPSYLAAYAFGEFFDYSGPVQGLVRTVFGFQTMRDYWFPDIRSTRAQDWPTGIRWRIGAAAIQSEALSAVVCAVHAGDYGRGTPNAR